SGADRRAGERCNACTRPRGLAAAAPDRYARPTHVRHARAHDRHHWNRPHRVPADRARVRARAAGYQPRARNADRLDPMTAPLVLGIETSCDETSAAVL